MGVQFTETEIDRILDSVDAAMGKAQALAKSTMPASCAANGGPVKLGLKKDDMPVPPSREEGDDAGSASPSPESAPAEGSPEAAPAPAPEAAAPAPDGAPEATSGAEGAPEAPQPGQPEGEQQLEGESDAPLSDEELSEIYGSMEPQELERHFMLIRGLLQQAYAKEGGQPAAPGAPAPEAGAPAAAPAPEAAAPAEPMVQKSEVTQLQTEHEQLKKQYAELQKSLENTVKVLEVAFKPERKAVTSIEFIKKGEESTTSSKSLVKSEVIPVLNELTRSGKLSKSDRDVVNGYILRNEDADKIAEIINRK